MRILPLFDEPPSVPGAGAADVTPPRVYRAQILRLRSAGHRRDALARIADAKTRAVVRFYIEDHFARLHRRALPDLARIEREEVAKPMDETACETVPLVTA